jgi:hypothetical protein
MTDDFRAQITREDIEEALAALDRGESHSFGPSTFYDLLERGKPYPPKAVLGLAARRALGRPLRRSGHLPPRLQARFVITSRPAPSSPSARPPVRRRW